MKDIYFETNYGKLYEKIEDGTCEVFDHSSSIGTIRHMFIKREVPIRLGDITYYDLITPYGYGGPLILNYEKGRKEDLIDEFEVAFKQYCVKNNIVSEFVRFHPVVGNSADFNKSYKARLIRNTVGTNVTYQDPFMDEFSKSARKSVRRALRAGVDYKVTEKPDNLTYFKKIYYSTMDRNKATNYYYFDDDYFNACLEFFKDNIILVDAIYQNKVISAGFYFVYGDMIHAHLSGTLTEYINLSPAYVVKYATVLWAKDHNIRLIHYGGGTSNSEQDSLYRFKKQFGKNTEFEFYVGKKAFL
jgi:lipid II:glycine glycyltransferase (peptidoglycan interpeptide bridge formation enzyme)